MAKATSAPTFLGSMLTPTLHKRNQGRRTRQVTAFAIALAFIIGCWSASQGPLSNSGTVVQYVIPYTIALLGCWFAFRCVNYPVFADFLIAVEAEMAKVSWPDRRQLYRATVVVLGTMFIMGLALFIYDAVWQAFFSWAQFLRI